MTVSSDFLAPLSPQSRRPKRFHERATHWLRLRSGESVDRYFTKDKDSFRLERAARVGARVPFAWDSSTAGLTPSPPLAKLIADSQPAIVVVTFGANDASYRPGSPESLAAEFDTNLMKLVALLEDRGIVVVLSNEMRHLDQPGVRACPADDPIANDWRIAVASNAIARRTAEIACREHLPFIDLRAALELATNHGLSPDGVHPSVHPEGGGLIDEEGLDCGYNIRNFVTLVALRHVVDAIENTAALADQIPP